MSTIRTSASHPLRIDSVRFPGGGELGLTLCPGKHQHDGLQGAWARDLDADVDAIAAWGATVVLTLMESDELRRYKVPNLPVALQERRIAWIHAPIVDGGVPDAAFEAAWPAHSAQLHEELRGGGKVLIHCRGGLGRTGLAATMLWLEALAEADLDAVLDAAAVIEELRRVRPGLVENRAQSSYLHAFVAQARRVVPGSLRDRARGCLLGGAVGDALGAPVEFDSDDVIRARFGADGVRAFAEVYGKVGAITDDTQMTLFTAEGLIRAWVRGTLKGIVHVPSIVHAATLRWLVTQGVRPSIEREVDGWLSQQPELHARRGPGDTCLKSLRAATSLGELPVNDRKGCGGVMRVAPVGIYSQGEDAFALAAECAQQTHGHPSGYLASGWMASCVSALARGASLRAAIDRAHLALAHAPAVRRQLQHFDETRVALNVAIALATSAIEQDERPARIPAAIGAGWVAEEAMAIGLYCAMLGEAWVDAGRPVAEAFEDAVSLAVSHGGDSDSTGSIAGQLLGARFGEAAIPARWAEQVELRDVTLAVADVLAGVAEHRLDAERLWERFPGW